MENVLCWKLLAKGLQKDHKKEVLGDLSILVQTRRRSTVCQLDKQILLVVKKFKNDLASVERKHPSARKG